MNKYYCLTMNTYVDGTTFEGITKCVEAEAAPEDTVEYKAGCVVRHTWFDSKEKAEGFAKIG